MAHVERRRLCYAAGRLAEERSTTAQQPLKPQLQRSVHDAAAEVVARTEGGGMYSSYTRAAIGFVVGLVLFLAAASTAAAAGSGAAPPGTIPARLAGLQYPGSALSLPEWRDDPMVRAHVVIPDWLARVQYPGTSSQPTVALTPTAPASSGRAFDWGSAGIGAGFVAGLGLLGAGVALLVRRWRAFAHA
jgi:hypothetical protein